jgi:hypothetical protein
MNIFQIIRSFKNNLDFTLRQRFRWQRPGFVIPNEKKDGLFSDLSESDRCAAETMAAGYLSDYHLENLFVKSSKRRYRENLYYLELLEQTLNSLNIALPPSILAADIGVSDWFYARAYHSVLKWWRFPAGRQVKLDGYEVDAYRLYADFYSRYDYAMTYIRDLENTNYHPAAFETQAEKFHFVSLLFPFVFARDHLQWGLPVSRFQPIDLLEKAWESVHPGGILMIVNQGKNEQGCQQELLMKLGIKWAVAFQHDSVLFKYHLSRFVTAAVKNG